MHATAVRSGLQVLCLCSVFTAVGAEAAFQRIENFDALTLGDIDSQDGWSASAGSGTVVLEQPALVNRILEVDTESGVLYKAVSIAEGTSRTVFFRFRFAPHGRFSLGFSHLASPSEYGDFMPEIGMAAATNNDPGDTLRVAADGTAGTYDTVAALLPGTWYNTWVHIDNAAGQYQIWMNTDAGAMAADSDRLSNAAAETAFGFRATTTAAIQTFYIKTSGGNSIAEGRFYLDDLFIEDGDALNLDNPLAIADSNSDGMSDSAALALGLDPSDTDGDTDDDGLSDIQETGGDPAAPLPVDSDGDGVIDALEPGVTASDASVANGVALTGDAKAIITSRDGHALSAVGSSVVGTAPVGVSFPFGTVDFSCDVAESGSALFLLQFSDPLPASLSLYALDTAGEVTEVSADNWTKVDDQSLEVTLVDGEAILDQDGAGNATIVASLAPAAIAPRSSGGSGCSMSGGGNGADSKPEVLLLLLAVIAVAWRRCRAPARYRSASAE